MAGGSAKFNKDFKKWQKDLDKAIKPDTFHKMVRDKHLPVIVTAIVGSAKAGIGPDGPYDAYKPSYQKVKGQQAVQLWLSVSGDMLDPERFSMVIHAGTGRAWIRWEGPVYGAVHQGDSYGGASDTRENIPPRPWLHFDNPTNEQAAMVAYELAADDVEDAFNAGTL